MAATALPSAPAFPPLRRTPLGPGEDAPPSGALDVDGLRVLHDGAGPLVLLVGAAGASADAWDPRPLVRAGYEVVRLDAGVDDLARRSAHVVGVLDALGAHDAHLVGDPEVLRSTALAVPERIRSLTLVGADEGGTDDIDVPTLLLSGTDDSDRFAALVARHLWLAR